MLHNIDQSGAIQWHCRSSPTCVNHNCAAWNEGIRCAHHPQQDQVGQTLAAHLSDPGVQWTSDRSISLPACPVCGCVTMLLVHSDEELTPPIIKRDEQTGRILQVVMPSGHEHHGSLWFVDKDAIKRQVPHPAMAHLSPAEIQQLQETLKAKAPDAPVDWMLSEIVTEQINRVIQHPAVERHRELARQMNAAGKTWQPE